jgi:hypothetical protein
MKEALSFSETSVPTRATRRNIPEDAILRYWLFIQTFDDIYTWGFKVSLNKNKHTSLEKVDKHACTERDTYLWSLPGHMSLTLSMLHCVDLDVCYTFPSACSFGYCSFFFSFFEYIYIYTLHVSTWLTIFRCTGGSKKARASTTDYFLGWYCAATTHVFGFTWERRRDSIRFLVTTCAPEDGQLGQNM